MITKFRFLLEDKQGLSLGDFDEPQIYIYSVKKTCLNGTKYHEF